MVCYGTHSRLLRLSLILVLGLFSSEVSLAQETEKERQLAEQLLELEDAIEELLADLPPDARDRVRALTKTLRAQATARSTEAASAPAAPTEQNRDDAPSTAEPTLPAEPAPEIAEAEADVTALREQAAPPAPEPTGRPAPDTPTPDVPAPIPSETPRATEPETPSAEAAKPDIAPAAAPPEEPDCQPLALFDTSEDGVLSGADRLWRHFYLKTDLPKDDGVVSLFELDIRSVALDVETYGVKGDAEGYVQRTSKYRFQVIGRAARKVRDGFLAVDASGLARNGTVRLLDASGSELEGIQVLERGQTLVFADGERVATVCR